MHECEKISVNTNVLYKHRNDKKNEIEYNRILMCNNETAAKKRWIRIFQYFRTIIRLLTGVLLLYLIRGSSSPSSAEFSSITMLFSIRIRLETSVHYH